MVGVVMRVVLLNSPPKAGKDSAGRALLRAVPNTEVVKLAGVLKAATHTLFGIGHMAIDAFELCKDQPCADFNGMTPREAYITVSEKCIKPVFGAQFFGHALAARIRRLRACDIAVVTDSGFEAESLPIIEAFGAENVLLIRLHRDGCDFSGDSRGYIDLPGVTALDIANNGTLADFGVRVVHAVTEWDRRVTVMGLR